MMAVSGPLRPEHPETIESGRFGSHGYCACHCATGSVCLCIAGPSKQSHGNGIWHRPVAVRRCEKTLRVACARPLLGVCARSGHHLTSSSARRGTRPSARNGDSSRLHVPGRSVVLLMDLNPGGYICWCAFIGAIIALAYGATIFCARGETRTQGE